MGCSFTLPLTMTVYLVASLLFRLSAFQVFVVGVVVSTMNEGLFWVVNSKV